MVNGEKQLPDGWNWAAIGEIAKNINPGFPSGRHNQESLGVPHIRPMNISRNGDVDLAVVKYVEATDYLPLLQGDVLFNNTNSPELVGKTTYIRQDTNWAYSNHMTRIRLDNKVAYAGWVANALHYLFLDGYFKINCRHHVNQASVSSGFLAQNVKIPLPPLPEQERIVGKIEELFTQLDAGTSALERVQAGLRRYKASVLKTAVEGKLVGAHGMRPSGRTPSARTDEVPEGWQQVEFKEIITSLKNGFFYGRPSSEPIGIPILRISAVRPMSVNFSDLRYIPEGKEKDIENYYLLKGDLLFTRYNGNLSLVGACGLVRDSKRVIYPDKLIRVRVQEIALPEYLEIYFATVTARKLVESRVKSTAGQHGISGGDIKSIPVILPPLEEQRRIVAEVERRLSVARQVESSVEEALVRASRLRQAVLKSAFEGRLTQNAHLTYAAKHGLV